MCTKPGQKKSFTISRYLKIEDPSIAQLFFGYHGKLAKSLAATDLDHIIGAKA